jgi:Rieske 2Fe-2S family protein
MITRHDMLASLQTRKAGFALPQALYTDANYFRIDMEMIWYREWLFAAHECEFPEPGGYVTLQIGDYPVLIVRDKGGQIRGRRGTWDLTSTNPDTV